MSIVILNYNRLHYSKQTLECIVARTTIPHEIILVDNNSTDGTREYLKSMEKKTNAQRVVCVFNDKNLGVAGGRNSGLFHASKDSEYLVTIDDDVLVPKEWDVMLSEACDKIPKLGITGVNVEPVKFPKVVINGAAVRPKAGNLGGACLCLPRRVFKRVGYYKVFGQYGLEDSDMYIRMQMLGLMSAYIDPKGVHLDTDADKVYRKVKTRAHTKGSTQLKAFVKARNEYKNGAPVFEPYTPYDPDAPEWRGVESLDGTIGATADIPDLLKAYKETAGMKVGNKLEIINVGEVYSIDTGAETRVISKNIAEELALGFGKNNIKYVYPAELTLGEA